MRKFWTRKNPALAVALGTTVLGLAACSSSSDKQSPDSELTYEEYQQLLDAGGTDTESALFEVEEATPETVFTMPVAQPMEEENFAQIPKEAPAAAPVAGAPVVYFSDTTSAANNLAPYRKSQFTRIAPRPFIKEDRVMNAYIFVRSEQSWQELSQLLYGDVAFADTLATWNSAAPLKSGTLVYYNSPFRPEDQDEMKSFENDFGMTLESVTVEKGDSLSLIGQRLYGDVDTWREIASLNQDQLYHPDVIEIGQNIRVASQSRQTMQILQDFVAQVRAEAEAAALAGADLEAEQSAQDEYSEQVAQIDTTNDMSDSSSAQAPPSYEQETAEFEADNYLSDIEPAVAEVVDSNGVFMGFQMEELGLLLVALILLVILGMRIARQRKAKAARAQASGQTVQSVSDSFTGTDD